MVVVENTNLIVYNYLKITIGDKGANLFKKKAQLTTTDLPEGSPSIPEIVSFYEKFAGEIETMNKNKETSETVNDANDKDEENAVSEADTAEKVVTGKKRKAKKNGHEELSNNPNTDQAKSTNDEADEVASPPPKKEVDGKKSKTKKVKKSKA